MEAAMYYINTKFGFIRETYPDESYNGEPVLKARFCQDVREALPFESRGEAEKLYKQTMYADWYHCILSTE